MPEHFALTWLLLKTGFIVTVIHEYLYIRTGGDDYELGGTVSHAGSDLIILTAVMVAVGTIWSMRRDDVSR